MMFRTRKLTDDSLTRKLAYLGVSATLLGSLNFSAPSVALAQGQATARPIRTELERHLRVKRSDLIAKDDVSDLPVSPVYEDNLPGSTVGERGLTAAPRSTIRPDIHGETSVENFQGTQNNLSYTHESADGFRQYLEARGYSTNFHRRDSEVGSWLFHDFNAPNRDYDLWPFSGIDYGIDAVRAAFHSSHGGMDNNVFRTSLGADWASTGWDAQSDMMALGGNWNSYGDERLRYVFWDACNSVMVSGGNDPYTTWGRRSKGIRFVFGYETTSIDSPNYGKFFWEEWSKGKTFKYAFLDASWRISNYQAPALVAFGATPQEAESRRDTERYLFADPVSNSWGAWAWYDARRTSATNASLAEVSAQAQSAPRAGRLEVAGRGNSNEEVTEIARAFGIRLPNESVIKSRPTDVKLVKTNAATLVVEKNGNFELTLDTAEGESKTGTILSDESLIDRAEQMADKLSLVKGQDLRVGMIRDLNENEGAEGFEGVARVTEKTVVFDQTVNGIPFIDPEAGHLEITFAPTGKLKRVRNTLKAIRTVADNRENVSAHAMTLDEARQAALAAFNQTVGSNSRAVTSAEIIEGSEAVGYQLIDGHAVLVYRAHLKSSAAPRMRPFQAIIPMVR